MTKYAFYVVVTTVQTGNLRM